MADPQANNDAGGPLFRVSGHDAFNDDAISDEQLEALARFLLHLTQKTADQSAGGSQPEGGDRD